MRAPRRAAPRQRRDTAAARNAGNWRPPSARRRDEAPQSVGALRRDLAAQAARPPGLAAELVAPGPEAARRVVQRVFLRETDGAMHLVRDRGADARRLSCADLRRSYRQ